jgi:hypothetical protein
MKKFLISREISLARRARRHRHLSDFEGVIVANLREQARLKAELARMQRINTASEKLMLAPRVDQLRADLVALGVAINLHRQQKSRDG